MNRRTFLAGSLNLAAARDRHHYRFATAECEIEMSVEFHDRHSAGGLQFRDLGTGGRFCLSTKGERDRDCAREFVGSLAIANYRIRPRSRHHRIVSLRECVKTIDHDHRFDLRPPWEATLELRQGMASDIQAFGYEGVPLDDAPAPWYYFRQDLYLDARGTPFLVLHWKHALNAIRMLDVIPGDGTWQVEK